jgi:hypothetical protein
MHMHGFFDELDLLDDAQNEAEQIAEEMHFESDVDRRKFIFLSITAAAASTFGFGAKALAQGTGRGADSAAAGAARGGAGQGRGGAAAVPFTENMENISWTFQPYPGGTGAAFDMMLRKKGAAAFKRATFVPTPWPATKPVPKTAEDLAFLPAHQIAALIRAKKLTSMEITKIYLERLKKYDPALLCVVNLMENTALEEAAKMDAEVKAGKPFRPLHGVPYGVKDLFATKGVPTTWGSADFKDRILDFDAEVVVRLREAGAVLLAKLSTGQYASGDMWYRGRTNNPWNYSQGSSGSSAGPASATAGGCVAFGIGTETQGSIVSPATACGLSALRPTYGRVSRHGGMVLAWSMDRVGPITRTVEDAAMVFNVLHGVDEKDPSTVTMPFQFNRNIPLASLRIGLRASTDPNLAAFVEVLKGLGAKPKELGNPPTVAGSQGAIGTESAAAFDFFTRRKAAELGIDLAVLDAGRGGAGGPGRGAAADSGRGGAPARGAAAGADSGRGAAPAPGRGGGGGGRGLGPGAGGRTTTALSFLQGQRYRLQLITAWQEYLKDFDLYLGGNDIGAHAQTGHPVAVVPIGFAVRGGGRAGGGGGGRAGRGGDSITAAPPPQPALNPMPLVTSITGNLYNDDMILSVAHKYQMATKWHLEKPKMG